MKGYEGGQQVSVRLKYDRATGDVALGSDVLGEGTLSDEQKGGSNRRIVQRLLTGDQLNTFIGGGSVHLSLVRNHTYQYHHHHTHSAPSHRKGPH